MFNLVIQCALVDPVCDQLDLRRRELGSALGHLLRGDHFDQKAVGCIAWRYDKSIV